ncbi:LOB domain-containing protein 31-like [Juglans microcarpa x Juglans regia]|uniref:LOB domain-containing protein 31-like n=1 Tax=Juglans microcarpa x Juglans regia TaxID=2249226 RepID=UPI001B7E15D5|nr:LOB domain-containing protein 31-like [Juglans microcarpa x Juglans regia]
MSASNGGGPCGACKFLRRKCINGCVFAPYFDSDQGTAHFAAVHKVFGASNASKLLLRIPAHKRLDAVVTLCYEAESRVRDPVYGCVGHIFTLQQQVVNLQAELAFVQARLATLHRLPPPHSQSPSPTNHHSSSDLGSTSDLQSNSNSAMHFDPVQPHPIPTELTSFLNSLDGDLEAGNAQVLAREIISRYLPGVRFRPSSPN